MTNRFNLLLAEPEQPKICDCCGSECDKLHETNESTQVCDLCKESIYETCYFCNLLFLSPVKSDCCPECEKKFNPK